MRRFLVGVVYLAAASIALGAAESAQDQLGRTTQWFLTFATDPYGVNDPEIAALKPEQAAAAIKLHIDFPVDGDSQEMALIHRHNKIDPKTIPRSLRKFVEKEFKAWTK